MNCSNCGSPSARIRIRIADGVEKKVCLCDDCYQKLYPKLDASELFARLFGGGITEKKHKVCPSCGMTLERFRETGLLGCAGCYSAFRNEIYNSVRYCQWGFVHKGKEQSAVAEEKYDQVRELVREQESVKSQFDLAMKRGDGSLAEEYKQRLKIIHDKLVQAGEE